ncbi:CPBP family intramembrane glutamic endopeptidase [Lacisediminihabitans sp. FW035]
MISPDSPAVRAILLVVLAGLIALLVYRAVRKDRTEFQRFKRFERTRNRQRMMRKWLLDSLSMFGGAAVVILLLAAQFVPLFSQQVARWPVGLWWRSLLADTGGLVPGLATGFAVALVGGTIAAVALARRAESVPTIGDIGALLPRNRPELVLGALLSVNAGVVEELLFRLAVPALVFGATGSASAAVIGSVLLFGALHFYQGWPGIVGATVIGALLMALYLASGSILVAIVAHALIDLRSLVLIPMLVFGVHRVRG